MIKKIGFFVVMAAIIAAFGGCQKEELTDRQLTDEVQPQEVVQPDVYVENGYLAFKNIEVVDSVVNLLNKMTTSGKETWENQLGFKSARAEFDALFEKYDELPTYEAFLAFKEKYKEKLIFNENDPDDCSIDYPYVTDYFIPVLNNKGLVKIGESLIIYTKSEHIVIKNGNINALNNLEDNVEKGDVFVYPKLRLKSTYNEDDLIHDFPEDIPYGADSPWHKIQGNDSRRLNNQLRINRYRYAEYNYQTNQLDWVRGYNVYFKQRGQKKSWLGSWKDYKTTYIFDDLAVKVGNEPTSEFNPYSPVVSPEVKPHATIGLYWHVHRMPDPGIPNYVPPLLAIPDVSISILTSFRGFGVEALYNVDHTEHSGFPGTSFPYNPVPGY